MALRIKGLSAKASRALSFGFFVVAALLAIGLVFPGSFASSLTDTVTGALPGASVIMGEKVQCEIDVINPSGTLFNPTGDPPEFNSLASCTVISDCRYGNIQAASLGDFFSDDVAVELVDSEGERVDSEQIKVFERSSPLGSIKTVELTGCTFDGSGTLFLFDDKGDVLDEAEFDAL